MPARPSEEFQRNVFITVPLMTTTLRAAEGFSDEDLSMMPVSELIAFIREWVRINPA